jgi:hypothetical protein
MANANPPLLPASVLVGLVALGQRARRAQTAAELCFLAVNESHTLGSYRQSALWQAGRGVITLSGVVQVEANAPYAQWLERVLAGLAQRQPAPGPVSIELIPSAERESWGEWLPLHALWIPLSLAPSSDRVTASGGILFARDQPWSEAEITLFGEWMAIWLQSWQLQHSSVRSGWLRRILAAPTPSPDGKPGFLGRSRAFRWAIPLLIVAAGFLPVRLTVLAPGEIVPREPAVIRAPVDGVIDRFHVQPNDSVQSGQPLFGFDEEALTGRLEVARQVLVTAEAELRQTGQQALLEAKFKAGLAMLAGRVQEQRASVAALEAQLELTRVSSPRDGIVLFDDPAEWIGRPVSTGERVMRIASLDSVEIEAWIPLADAIPFPDQTDVTLYLTASPLDPVRGTLRYLAHESVQRPDGSYAYRLRAALAGTTGHRVGLKGMVKVDGRRVPLAYWVFRRPWAAIRLWIGY